MIKTCFNIQQVVFVDSNSGKLKFITDSRIDLNHCNLKFVSDLSFVIYLKFGACILEFKFLEVKSCEMLI